MLKATNGNTANQVEQREDGWHVRYSDGSGSSGPWKTKEAAEYAMRGQYADAHWAERIAS